MTKDRNLYLSVPLRKKGDSIIPPLRKSSYSPLNGLEGGKKSSRRQGNHAIDQVRVEDEQSELRVKDELATRMELEFPRRAACRMRSCREYSEGCCNLLRIVVAISISNKFSH